MKTESVFEYGFERDRLGPTSRTHLTIRWWFYLDVPGEKLRSAAARQGVPDPGFRFARGGRTSSEEEARRLLSAAHRDAVAEADFWRGQPSHALGPAGNLIPLVEIVPELPA